VQPARSSSKQQHGTKAKGQVLAVSGVEFIAEIERCVTAAADRPTLYSAVYKDVRRVVANRFPFSVYFRAEERRIVVLAVFHGSRDPSIWQQRT
jgi:plasmid stabilization system protein ParE